jgi:alpha-glucosidase
MSRWFPYGRVGVPVAARRVDEATLWLEPEGAEACPQFPWVDAPSAGTAVPDDESVMIVTRGPKRTTLRIDLAQVEDWYGQGLVWGPLRRNGTRTACWNTDTLVYRRSRHALYQSHPWLMGVKGDGSCVGLVFETTRHLEMRVDGGVRARVAGGGCRVLMLMAASPLELVRELSRLTGYMAMPPLWALGYHQCRWSYATAEDAEAVARRFREREIPCDAIWMDIDYMDGYRVMTFSDAGFPAPEAFAARLRAEGFRAVWIVDPGVKEDEAYALYREGTEKGYWVMHGKTPARGRVWPGWCVFPDYMSARVREWWAGWLAHTFGGVADGIWCDMNEPALMGLRATLPRDARHSPDHDAFPCDHDVWHNLYGYEMCRAAHEGLVKAHPDRRPFILTRAGFLGSQQFAATWSGDNRAASRFLKLAVVQSLSLGLSGQPFSGHDAGGFEGRCSPEQFVHWFGVCSLLPFFRGHASRRMPPREPWEFGEWAEARCRAAIQRRYRLLPYLYTQFYRASLDGTPVVRPLFTGEPQAQSLRREESAFMIGDDLLVLPDCLLEGRAVPCPAGEWVSVGLLDGDPAEIDLPRLLLRRGTILPLGPIIQHTESGVPESLELVVAADKAGSASSLLYEDDGEGGGYREGRFRYTALSCSHGTLSTESRAGEWGWPDDRHVTIRVVS